MRILGLLTLVALVELLLLIWLVRLTSFSLVLAVVIGTGFVGVALARYQGLQALTRVQQELRQGRMPATVLFDGLLILAAGVLLLTPGLLADGVGILLLVPPVRKLLRVGMADWIKRNTRVGVATFGTRAAGPDSPGTVEIIDAEYARLPARGNDPVDESR